MEEKKTFGTGAKVWLWLVLVLNAISALTSIMTIAASPLTGILSVLAGALAAVGAAVLMFKMTKMGFYIICGGAVCGMIGSIITSATLLGAAGIVGSVVGAVLMPLITFFVIKSKWNELA